MYYKSGLIPFIVDKENSFILEFSRKMIRFYAKHGTVVSNDVAYTITSPYDFDELYENNILKIRYVQNGDILYLFHPNHPIMTLTRNSNTNWTLEEFELKNGAWGSVSPTETTITLTQGTDIIATSTVGIFNETDEGRLLRLTVVDDNTTAWQAEKSVSANDIRASDNKFYKALASGTTGTYKPVHGEGTKSDGGVVWKYIHSGYVVLKITEYTSSTQVKVEVVGEDEIPSQLLTDGTDYYEMGLIHKGAEYPICGTFFRNRFVFMINVEGIPYVCFSNSDDYDNFADKEHGEVLAKNAITVQVVSSKYNKGCWLSGAAVLFVGTTTGEFYIDSASAAEALAPDNVKIQQISAVGSLPITPVRVGSHTMFVTSNGTSIRDIIYSYSTDTYDPVELSLLGKHLIISGINGMSYQEYPDKIVWFTVNDGRLIGMTFMSEQNVQALHQHYLGGSVENIAVIPNPNYNIDDVWLVVDRDKQKSIEWLDNGFVVQYPDEINNIINADEKEKVESDYMKKNAFYLDGGLSLSRTPYKGVHGNIYAETSNMYKEVILLDEHNNTDQERKTLSADDNSMLFDSVLYKDDDCSFSATIPYTSGDSTTYTISFDESLIGKTIKIEQFYTYYGGRLAQTLYWGEIDFTSYTFNLDAASPKNVYAVKIMVSDTVTNEDVPISGLYHLEGKEVALMIDGAYQGTKTVENGTIFIPNKSYEISVGLPVDSVYIPQRMYVQGGSGSGVGDVQRIDHITFMFWRSMGGHIGQDFSRLQPLYFRATDEVMGESAPLYTGNKTVAVDYNTSTIKEKGAQIVIRNDTVFPMNILAIAPHFSTSGNGL